MMTTLTFQLESNLKTQLKMHAVSRGKSIKEITTEAIEFYLRINSNKNLQSSEY
jgi:predicted transcriptional regulator